MSFQEITKTSDAIKRVTSQNQDETAVRGAKQMNRGGQDVDVAVEETGIEKNPSSLSCPLTLEVGDRGLQHHRRAVRDQHLHRRGDRTE